MLGDLILWPVSFFVIEPVQSEMARRPEAVGAPAAVIQDLRARVREGTPALAERVASGIPRALGTGFAPMGGRCTPEVVPTRSSARGGPAIAAARLAPRGRPTSLQNT